MKLDQITLYGHIDEARSLARKASLGHPELIETAIKRLEQASRAYKETEHDRHVEENLHLIKQIDRVRYSIQKTKKSYTDLKESYPKT